MWWYMLLVGCIQTAILCAQPLDTSNYPLWAFNVPNGPDPMEPSDEDNRNELKINMPVRLYAKDPELVYNSKRAFTLLSRWKPFSTLGRNSPSIREQNRQIYNDLDIETRAMLRPVGQPLRWG